MLERIGLTEFLNQKVKCENKLGKTRLSFPQASQSSDTFFLDSKLLFSQQLFSQQPSAHSLVLTFLPAANQHRKLPRHSQTWRSWSSSEICCCRQLGRVSETSGLPLIAPRELCNPFCAFSKGITGVSWVMKRGKEGAWSRSSRKEQLLLHLSHSSAPQSVLEFTSIMSQPYQ